MHTHIHTQQTHTPHTHTHTRAHSHTHIHTHTPYPLYYAPSSNNNAIITARPLQTPSFCIVIGGVSFSAQVNSIKRGVDCIFATPGRLVDLVQKRLLKLNRYIFVHTHAHTHAHVHTQTCIHILHACTHTHMPYVHM